MPVFNAAENQVLASPVTNYYQGKAIRQQLEAGEVDIAYKKTLTEKYRQEIDDAPARKAAAEEMAAANYALVLENIRSKRLDSDDKEIDRIRDIVGPWVQEYGERAEDDPKAALAWANENLAGVLERYPPEQREEFLRAVGPDHVLDFNEISSIGLGLKAYEADKDPDPTSHQQVLDDLVERKFITEEQRNQTLLDIETKAGATPGADDGASISDRRLVSKDLARAVHSRYGGLFGPDGEPLPLEEGLADKEGAVSRLAESLWGQSDGALGIEAAADIAYNLVERGDISPDEIRGNKSISDEELAAASEELGISVEDIKFTAKEEGISVEEAIRRLKAAK